MYEVLIVCYLLVALALIGLVLIQQGKGADMGASFGAGASGTLFGSSGSGNFLTRATSIMAITFFVLSLLIGRMSANTKSDDEAWQDLSQPGTAVEEPVEPAKPAEETIPE
ncbi:preprotein translocase subunit SecG [Paraferrimonas sedimenticola]|uniref:Protein-export membrane protein SecG n=1 Tax=Paraferrimonas sedimenticola TaxID=375674 RepID=A0AA37RYV4_9GAMM|nr:preprotein translocase subunit SecG [Paraferrimonas sedimenticola]GLP97072.1 preprotein translocase subunit SecG [Paraferrimonas sedimenticola]